VRVALVAGICVRHDAISRAVEDQAHALLASGGVESVHVFTHAVDHDLGVPTTALDDPWQLLGHRHLRDADVVVLHWGIAYGLFDALAVLENGPRGVAVHFHNRTPHELLRGVDRDKAEWSERQVEAIVAADVPVWTYSELNRRTLLHLGVDERRLQEVPIAIEPPALTGDARPVGTVELLTVGRFVPAKGLDVLLDALVRLRPPYERLVSATLAGNAALSDSGHLDHLRARIDDLELGGRVRIVVAPEAPELHALYRRSHVVVSPSFHEGLCVPVVEGYLAGCRAIGTDAGNLPFLVAPPDPVVPAGDSGALADAIELVAADVLAGRDGPGPAARAQATRFLPSRAHAALLDAISALAAEAR
jgi:glycosyltransferase involved in cell wall biosynthesis